MSKKFSNRIQAGQMLAQHLQAYSNLGNVLVLALPRGGVPVAFEVAKFLNVALDVCIVRKLGVPGHKELAMGAIAQGLTGQFAGENITIFNQDVIDSLGIDQEKITAVVNQELRELRRRHQIYRGDKPAINVKNKIVILIDDGIATGASMRAALTVIHQQQPEKIVVAVPVAPLTTCEELRLEVDDVVCLRCPEVMSAIGFWYEDFSQTTDNEVRALLVN
ncbi:MAG: phosphoribosyltransferase [Dolichospermum sp. DET50]|nr:phosphoribosyltransferase [Dolichospermum sp. DET66]MBS3032479.1 phosphoribosyltransferase [Dolichospermum sp. DET67]MBS3037685.1 phosphoribosyltransferase [Dolichospermum sp. DET50]QSX69633.1 MAG: phosphoribosyltransferase [Dolichospermum sp. DET69]